MKTYDVAIWLYRYPDGLNFCELFDDDIQAESPLQAVIVLLSRHKHTSFTYACAGVKGTADVTRLDGVGIQVTYVDQEVSADA
jgi:hypothetical protein